MIKNLNDLLSIIVLALLLLLSLRIVAFVFIKKDEQELAGINKFELIKDYIDNEEE